MIDAYRAAKILLDVHGSQEAWRFLTARAIDEHLASDEAALAITLAVQEALRVLVQDGPEGGERVQ